MYLKEKLAERNIQEKLKKSWFHIALLCSFSVPIVVLMVLDYLDVESASFWIFNQEFRFLSTWKGRMFYLFFLWLLFIETVIDWNKIVEKKPKNRFRILIFFVCAAIPLIYVLGVNFWGLDQVVFNFGRDLGFTDYSLEFHWPLCLEYLVFAIPFLVAVLLAYKKEGLGFFSIALSLLVGMSIVYAINTFYPPGAFWPFEMLTLPTSACAAALLDILGYSVSLSFQTGPESMPVITIQVPNVGRTGAAIGWPCAGVHSLFLFTVIILLFFKRSNILTSRKFVYFIIGAFCTYFVNVLRIASYFVILRNNGSDAARFFHNSLGELYFVSWIFIYIFMIISIERFKLAEKARRNARKLRYFLKNIKDKFLSFIRKNRKQILKEGPPK